MTREHRAGDPRQDARVRARIRRPPGHWPLLALLLTVLLVLLLVDGFTTKTVGVSGTPGSQVSARAPLAGSRPLLEAGPGRLVSHQPPPGRRVALTFDDGPDPHWTPRIVRVLRRFHVPATFFEIGSQVARYPGIVAGLHRDGFELGNHTFTHADLATLPGWAAAAQVDTTESAIAGVTGVRPRLLRPPYSSMPDAVTPKEERTLLKFARDGYVIALADFDGRDWDRPGVGSIVHAVTPPGRRGGVILLHDGGGNRSQTVAAVRRLIPELRARGFRFVTVSALGGLPRSAVELPAGGWRRLRGHLFIAGLAISRAVTSALDAAVLVVGVLVGLRMLAVLLLARRHVRRRAGRLPGREVLPAVSIVVPAFNEAVGIERAVRSLAEGDHPELEVVVVDDGSTDGTAELVEALRLPNVRVMRQENAGKAAALNRGILAARHEIVATVDADTVFEHRTLRRLVQPFADPEVGAVSGNTKVGNRAGLLGRWQHIEYVIGFNLDRRMYEVLNCMPTVPGAIGAFRRSALRQIGGVSGATLAEDTDITMALGRAGWRVGFVPDARAWTEAPSSLGALWRQRYRWAYGTMQAIWKHRGALLRRSERRIGRRALPYLTLFQVVLPLFAPVIDLFAIYGLLFLNPLSVLAFWLGFNLFQLILAVYAFRLDGERLRVLWALPLQQFVYRQVMYLVVIESFISALTGARMRWQHFERTGEMELARR